jgi:hypothetical protein
MRARRRRRTYALESGEADDEIAGVVGHDLEEVGVVHDLVDHLVHVVRVVGIGRHQHVERLLAALPTTHHTQQSFENTRTQPHTTARTRAQYLVSSV